MNGTEGRMLTLRIVKLLGIAGVAGNGQTALLLAVSYWNSWDSCSTIQSTRCNMLPCTIRSRWE